MDSVSFISSDFARSKYSTGSTIAHGDVGESFSCIWTKIGCDVRKIHSTWNNSCPSWNIFLSLHNMQSIDPAHQDLLFTKCLDAYCQISQESEYVSMLVYQQSDSILRGELSSYCSPIDGTELSKRVTHWSSTSSDTKKRRARFIYSHLC